MKRKNGYYWVKYKNTWMIAKWDYDLDCWNMVGNEYDFYDHQFIKIDENQILRCNKLLDIGSDPNIDKYYENEN